MELGHSVIHGVLELGKLYAISFPYLLIYSLQSHAGLV